jgi:hypothetical protein
MTALVSLIVVSYGIPDHGIVSAKARSTVVAVESANRVSMMGGRRRDSLAGRAPGARGAKGARRTTPRDTC